MVTKENAKCLAEVNDILKNSNINVIKKIPYKIRKFIVQNMDKSYVPSIDYSKPLEKQNISKNAKTMIALIYRDYIAEEKERKLLIQDEIIKKKQNEERIKKLYNPENLFKNNKYQEKPKEQKVIIIEKKSFIYKLINLVKSIIKKEKGKN